VDLGIVIAVVGLIFAGFVKGSVGFGLPLLALPILSGAIGPRQAVIVMAIVNLLAAVTVAARARGVPLRSYAGLLVPMFVVTTIGTTAGSLLFSVLDQRALSVLVGLVAVGFALLSILRFEIKVAPRHSRLVGAVIGLFAGVLGGTTSVSATPIVLYYHTLRLPKRHFLVLLNVSLTAISLVQVTAYAVLGLYSGEILVNSALTMACVMAGVGLGIVVQERVNQRWFNRGVIAVIFAVGLNLVVRALLS
jgi:uncharacterized membrane protein YfcA